MTFYEKRLEGTLKKVETFKKKVERIELALSTGKNPYYYDERDLKISKRDLEESLLRVEELKERVAQEKQEANTRVPIIEEFLEKWKANAKEWYIGRCKSYQELLIKQRNENTELSEKRFSMDYKTFNATSDELYHTHIKEKNSFEEITKKVTSIKTIDIEKLDKILENEKNCKRKMLVDRVREITGEITDATGLYIGDNGEINGLVIGIRDKARVNTISAGGYNIQCFHFRVLVKRYS